MNWTQVRREPEERGNVPRDGQLGTVLSTGRRLRCKHPCPAPPLPIRAGLPAVQLESQSSWGLSRRDVRELSWDPPQCPALSARVSGTWALTCASVCVVPLPAPPGTSSPACPGQNRDQTQAVTGTYHGRGLPTMGVPPTSQRGAARTPSLPGIFSVPSPVCAV
jgi:hypothetical protein